jgi:hypothetical protein
MSASADIKRFMERMKQADRQTKAKALRRTDQFANHVLGDAQEITPVETGALQASGTAQPAVIEANGNIKAEIGFNTEYAAAVHERLDVHHEAPGQAKYLATALKNNQPKFAAFVGKDLI